MARRRSGYLVAKSGKETLPSFNINVGRHRTSVRLSPVVADAIERIAAHERCDLGELYTSIDRTKERGVSRSTAIREFALRYFIEAGTQAGHHKAGHGNLIRKRTSRPRQRDFIADSL